jgi:hypothetical protein
MASEFYTKESVSVEIVDEPSRFDFMHSAVAKNTYTAATCKFRLKHSELLGDRHLVECKVVDFRCIYENLGFTDSDLIFWSLVHSKWLAGTSLLGWGGSSRAALCGKYSLIQKKGPALLCKMG